MPTISLPDTFVPLLAAFQPGFAAPSYRTCCLLVAGWVHGRGRHTVTGLVVAAGAVGCRHGSAFHRCFARARWSLAALGWAVFTLAPAWIPPDRPRLVLADATLARQGGRAIAPASLHHDPLLASAREPFCSFGHVGVVPALGVPLPMGPRGFALPVRSRLSVGAKRGGRADAPGRRRSGQRVAAAEAAHTAAARPTEPDPAREPVGLVAGWAGARAVYLAADGAYAGRARPEGRPANVHGVGPLRMAAALRARPGRRRPGQQGRPRRRGRRRPR